MKNKGFTLIELLAVIVILAIILAIAVPTISSLIKNSQINAIKSNEKMLLKAARNYASVNENILPSNIGDTSEISLMELKDNNFITAIVSPLDKTKDCNGYILITKIEENIYDYTPHLNCVNNIGSSIEDGLVAHYKFDDFQEPTENLANSMTITGHGSSFISQEFLYNNGVVYRNTVTTPNIFNNFGFRSLNTNVSLDPNKQKNLTISFDNSVLTAPGGMNGYVQVKYTDATESGHSWNYSPSNWTLADSGLWKRVVGSANLTTSKIPEKISVWYVYRDSAVVGDMYVSNIQIEQKPYSTPYTEHIREGVVKDHSLFSNHIPLNQVLTPKYESGGYYYYNSSSYIEKIINQPLNSFSIGLNVRPFYYGDSTSKVPTSLGNSVNIVSFMRDSGAYNLGPFWLEYRQNGTMDVYIRRDSLTIRLVASHLKVDRWTNLMVTYDHLLNVARLYMDGEFLVEGQYASLGSLGNMGRLFLGPGLGTGTVGKNYNGDIDDFYFYNRTLVDDEVKQIYEKIKK